MCALSIFAFLSFSLYLLIAYKYSCCVRDGLEATREHHGLHPNLAFALFIPGINIPLNVFFLYRLSRAISSRFTAIGMDPHAHMLWLGMTSSALFLSSMVVDIYASGILGVLTWIIWWAMLDRINEKLELNGNRPLIIKQVLSRTSAPDASSTGSYDCDQCRRPLNRADIRCGHCGFSMVRRSGSAVRPLPQPQSTAKVSPGNHSGIAVISY
jgi:hypothetical protein